MGSIARGFVIAGAISLTLAIGLSAYGFHALQSKVSTAEIASWNWALQVQYLQSVGLLLVALLLDRNPCSRLLPAAGALMLIGMVLFSGSIYVDVAGLVSLGVAPLGGFASMLSWLLVAGAALRKLPR